MIEAFSNAAFVYAFIIVAPLYIFALIVIILSD